MKTFRKCVDKAREMRDAKDFSLNIKEYSPNEAYCISMLIKNDALFEFFDAVADIDIVKLYCICEYLEAQEKMKKCSGYAKTRLGKPEK